MREREREKVHAEALSRQVRNWEPLAGRKSLTQAISRAPQVYTNRKPKPGAAERSPGTPVWGQQECSQGEARFWC